MKWVLLVLKVFSITSAFGNDSMTNVINLYWDTSKVSPYDIHAPAAILSTFNLAVRGQLLSLQDDLSLGPGHIKEFYYDYTSENYILKLAEGIKFHNGREATAKDLEFSILRGFHTPDKSFFKTYFGDIVGIDKIKAGSQFHSGNVQGVKVVDKYTLKVQLTSANPAFFHSLTTPYFSLIPIEALNPDYLSWKDGPIGAGKYKVDQKFNGKTTVLEHLETQDKVIIYNFKDDKIKFDIAFGPGIVENEMIHFSDRSSGIRMFTISLENELSKNENFREGLKYLVDREEIKNNDLGISPLSQILPKFFWGRSYKKLEFNLDKAKEYFSKIPKELLDKVYEIPIFAGEKLSSKHLFYEKTLENQFKKVGFKVKFVPNQEKFISKETAQKSPLYGFSMVADYIDPLVTFSAFRKNGHEEFYRVPKLIENEYENLYESAIKSKTFTERLEFVKKLSQLSQDSLMALIVAEEKSVLYFNKKSISSLGKQNQPLTLNLENIITYSEVKSE